MDRSWDAVESSDESLNASRSLVKEIGYTVPVSKKSYVDLVRQLAGEVEDARKKTKAVWYGLAERDGKNKKFCLKEQLLPNDSEKVARLPAHVTAEDLELTARVWLLCKLLRRWGR